MTGQRPEWWTPEHEAAALEGLHINPVLAPQLIKPVAQYDQVREVLSFGSERPATYGGAVGDGSVEEQYGAETYNALAELRAAPADPERNARREAYRADQRRKAAAALDRLIGVHLGYDERRPSPATNAASERFVEAVGDYVLSRLHHKGQYGVTPDAPEECWEPAAHAGGHQPDPCTIKPEYGAAPNVQTVSNGTEYEVHQPDSKCGCPLEGLHHGAPRMPRVEES